MVIFKAHFDGKVLVPDEPVTLPRGQKVIVQIEPAGAVAPAAEDPTDAEWSAAIARDWASDLGDQRQDIYTLEDGEPEDGSR
ncbi:MAG: hypothetical protein JWO87_3603 [Phycisphaerales bacterium]|nr:hypothetical protein [Phycisphaerales bacterium]MDB5304102.1 hypothetical protein [Phycisphaerales bacterium]